MRGHLWPYTRTVSFESAVFGGLRSVQVVPVLLCQLRSFATTKSGRESTRCFLL